MHSNPELIKQRLDASRDDLVAFLKWIGTDRHVRLVAIDSAQVEPMQCFDMHDEPGYPLKVDWPRTVAWVHARNVEQRNVYWVCNQFGKMRDPRSPKPCALDMTAARYCFADADPDPEVIAREGFEAARALLFAADGFAANAWAAGALVIDSGNGVQAFFRLDQPASFHKDRLKPYGENWQEIQDCMVQIFGNDTAVRNRDRVMRLPYTWNWPNRSKLGKGYAEKPSWSSVLTYPRDGKTFKLEALHAHCIAAGKNPETASDQIASDQVSAAFDALTDENKAISRKIVDGVRNMRSDALKDFSARWNGTHRNDKGGRSIANVDPSDQDFKLAFEIFKFSEKFVADLVQHEAIVLYVFLKTPAFALACKVKPDPEYYANQTVRRAGERYRAERTRVKQGIAELEAAFNIDPNRPPPVGNLLRAHPAS